MATPIPFSVAAASRQGTFSTSVINYTGGYSQIYWELDIPNQSEYENAANSFTSKLLVNGVDSATTWVGGQFINKNGVVDPPPAIAFDISGYPAGVTLQISVNIPNTMTIGIQNGLIS